MHQGKGLGQGILKSFYLIIIVYNFLLMWIKSRTVKNLSQVLSKETICIL